MKITEIQKGIALMIVGFLILLNTLHALGWGINLLLITGSIAAIAWGFVLVDGYSFVKNLSSRVIRRIKK